MIQEVALKIHPSFSFIVGCFPKIYLSGQKQDKRIQKVCLCRGPNCCLQHIIIIYINSLGLSVCDMAWEGAGWAWTGHGHALGTGTGMGETGHGHGRDWARTRHALGTDWARADCVRTPQVPTSVNNVSKFVFKKRKVIEA